MMLGEVGGIEGEQQPHVGGEMGYDHTYQKVKICVP